MGKFKKKPVEIEANRVTEDALSQLAEWCGGEVGWGEDARPGILITTLEGIMKAHVGDWIIKGVKGEFYPCKPDIFEATYEQVDW